MEKINKNLSSKPIITEYYSQLNKIKLDKKPVLSIILVGSREDSLIYVNIKKKKCLELGIICDIYNYDNDIKFDINLSLVIKSHPNSFLYNLSEQLGLIGNKRNKYSNHLSCISANLMLLHLNRVGEFVYYSRDNNFYRSIKRYNPLKISIRKIKKIE